MTSNLSHDFEYCVDPDENESEEMLLEDEFSEPVAFRLGIVGVGQCGGNFAAQFYETGYRRILLINTAKTDLDSIRQPVAKLALSSAQLAYKNNGAGKNRDAARNCAEENETTIRTKFASVFRGRIDKLVICLALGGGTGSGAGPKVVPITA